MNTIATAEAQAATEIMKAAWYNQTGAAQAVLQLGELPLPSPGPGEVRVRVHTSGINPSDIASRSGSFTPPAVFPQTIPHSESGETILITGGAGGVGSFAVQIAANLGAHVIATASSRNHAFLRNLGASEIIDYNAIDFVEAVRSQHPDGVDAVLTTVSCDTKYRSIQTVRDCGRLVWISSEEPSGPPLERGIQGTMFYGRAEAESLDTITALIDAGRLKPFVEDVLPLEQAKEAQQRVASGRVRGKLVLKVT